MGKHHSPWFCRNCGDGPIPDWNPSCVQCDSIRNQFDLVTDEYNVDPFRPARATAKNVVGTSPKRKSPKTALGLIPMQHTTSAPIGVAADTSSTTSSDPTPSKQAAHTTPSPNLRNGKETTGDAKSANSILETHALVEHLVTIVELAPYIHDSIRAALEAKVIDQAKLQRKVHRQLDQMTFDIRNEASTPRQRRIAILMNLNSRAVSKLVFDRVAESLVGTSGSKQGSISPVSQLDHQVSTTDTLIYASSSEEETSTKTFSAIDSIDFIGSSDLMESEIRDFVIHSSALKNMSETIRDYVHPTLQSLLLKSAKRPGIGQSQDWIREAQCLANELEDVDPSTISTWESVAPGSVDLFKARIDNITGQSWDWWPLLPPCKRVGSYIEWICVSHTLYEESVSN